MIHKTTKFRYESIRDTFKKYSHTCIYNQTNHDAISRYDMYCWAHIDSSTAQTPSYINRENQHKMTLTENKMMFYNNLFSTQEQQILKIWLEKILAGVNKLQYNYKTN